MNEEFDEEYLKSLENDIVHNTVALMQNGGWRLYNYFNNQVELLVKSGIDQDSAFEETMKLATLFSMRGEIKLSNPNHVKNFEILFSMKRKIIAAALSTAANMLN